MVCPVGNTRTNRHDWVRGALLAWMPGIGIRAQKEQFVTEWKRMDKNGKEEEARLDIAYVDNRWGQTYLDAAVVESTEREPTNGNPEVAIRRRENTKHRRYPGHRLRPFVLDTHGRWGNEAASWLQHVTKGLHSDVRAAEIIRCKTMVSRALQLGVAEQLLSAVSAAQGGDDGSG